MSKPVGYPIGHEMYFKGDKIKVVSNPYEIYGGYFQEAVTEQGKEITIKAKPDVAKAREGAEIAN